MPGLYGADALSDRNTAEEVCRIHPDTARIYPVVILKGTKLGELYKAGDYQPRPFADMVGEVACAMEHFADEGIRVIKVGLHASEFVAANALGGYYHPAFRELCESRIYRSRMETAIRSRAAQQCVFAVHPACISKAVGQKRENIRYFRETYGIQVTIIGDENVRPSFVRFAGEDR
jgi:histone acetyltransferase (RNA polymerase elongator complex component)